MLVAIGRADDLAAYCLDADAAYPVLEAAKSGLLPLSCGLGTAVLGTPRLGIDIAAEFGAQNAYHASYGNENVNFGWPLFRIEPFPEPIPMKGAQGFWNWPDAQPAMEQY